MHCRKRIAMPCCRRPSACVWRSKMAGAQGWHRYVGDTGGVLSVDRFGASAPADVLVQKYGFTVDEVCRRVFLFFAAAPPALTTGMDRPTTAK